MSEANRLGQAGYLGDTGRNRKNFRIITDPQQSAAYGEKLLNIRIQLQDWSKQNPKATPQQWRDQFYQTVKPFTDDHLSSLVAPPSLQDNGSAGTGAVSQSGGFPSQASLPSLLLNSRQP